MVFRKILTYGGLGAIGAGTYYLYSAGGDPTLAEKKFEHDAATAAKRLRGDMSDRERQAKKAGEEGFEAVRATAQQYADQAKNAANQAEQKYNAYSADAKKKMEEARVQAEEEYRKAGKQVNAAANQFDKAVLDKAAESKSWMGGLWGGK